MIVILIHFMNTMQEGTDIPSASQVIVLNSIQEKACEILNSIHLYVLGNIYVKQPKGESAAQD